MSEETKNNEEIVINLDSFGVPLAIILAGVIIAGAVFLTNGKKDSNDVIGGQDNTVTTDDNNDDSQFPSASTTVDNDPYIGNMDSAKVAIVEFTDFQCSYCQRHVEQTYPDIIKNYVDTGEVVYVIRDFPLSFHGQIAVDTANAAECVYELGGQEAYSKYHDEVFLVESKDDLISAAKDIGIDMNQFNTCMDEERYADEIENDITAGQSAGVTGTPGFVIGILNEDGSVEGKRIDGAYPFSSFEEVIKEMLAK